MQIKQQQRTQEQEQRWTLGAGHFAPFLVVRLKSRIFRKNGENFDFRKNWPINKPQRVVL
jgi:hypothetical protein